MPCSHDVTRRIHNKPRTSRGNSVGAYPFWLDINVVLRDKHPSLPVCLDIDDAGLRDCFGLNLGRYCWRRCGNGRFRRSCSWSRHGRSWTLGRRRTGRFDGRGPAPIPVNQRTPANDQYDCDTCEYGRPTIDWVKPDLITVPESRFRKTFHLITPQAYKRSGFGPTQCINAVAGVDCRRGVSRTCNVCLHVTTPAGTMTQPPGKRTFTPEGPTVNVRGNNNGVRF